MTDTERKSKHVYRLAPCPDYDVEGMESWLADMAQQGLILAKDGFFAGIATFEKTAPKRILYRLEASMHGTSMWADNWGEPDSEAVELHQKYNWQYVAKRGEFYIYCSEGPAVRELNTDPEVQALALNVIRKKQIHNIASSLVLFMLLPAIRLGGTFLLAIIAMNTWYFIFTAVLCLWMLAGNLHKVFTLQKLQKKLRSGQLPQHVGKSKKHAILHHTGNVLQTMCIVIFLIIALQKWSDNIMEKNVFPLEEYPGDPPFATIMDVAGAGADGYQLNMVGMGLDGSRMFTDPLAPINIDWNEHADVTTADGQNLNCALYVNYHQTIHPALAQRLAKEYLRYAKRQHGYEPWPISASADLGVDYAAGYLNAIHQPSIILQKGTAIAHISFSQFASGDALSPEEWIKIMAENLT